MTEKERNKVALIVINSLSRCKLYILSVAVDYKERVMNYIPKDIKVSSHNKSFRSIIKLSGWIVEWMYSHYGERFATCEDQALRKQRWWLYDAIYRCFYLHIENQQPLLMKWQ